MHLKLHSLYKQNILFKMQIITKLQYKQQFVRSKNKIDQNQYNAMANQAVINETSTTNTTNTTVDTTSTTVDTTNKTDTTNTTVDTTNKTDTTNTTVDTTNKTDTTSTTVDTTNKTDTTNTTVGTTNKTDTTNTTTNSTFTPNTTSNNTKATNTTTFKSPLNESSSFANILLCYKGYFQKLNQCFPCGSTCRVCNGSTCIKRKFFFDTQQKEDTWIAGATAIASTPNNRILFDKTALIYLATDRVWLYQYHNREYHNRLTAVFETVDYIENKKFSPFQLDTYFEQLKIPDKFNLSIYKPFNHQKFRLITRNNGTILQSLQEYFLISIPVTAITFVVLYIVFRMLFNYKISVYLRNFSMLGFFFVSILEPHIQYMTFLFSNQMKMFFSDGIRTKVLLILWTIGFFFVFIYGVCAYMLFYYLYKKAAKYYLDDCYRVSISYIWYSQQIGLKSILLGFVHSLMYETYLAQLISLISIQILFLGLTIFIWKYKKIFILNTVAVCRIICSLLLISFQFQLLFELIFTRSGNTLNDHQKDLFDFLQYVTLIVLMSTSFLCFILKILMTIGQKIFEKKKDRQQQEEQQQNRSNLVNEIIRDIIKPNEYEQSINQNQQVLLYTTNSQGFNNANKVTFKKLKNQKSILVKYEPDQPVAQSTPKIQL